MANTNRPATNEDGRYTIPVANLYALQAKLGKLNRRAARIGCEPVGFTELARRVERVSHQIQHEEGGGHQEDIQREVVDIQLHGTAPKIAGWEFIGRIEVVSGQDGARATFMYAAPGKTIPAIYREQPHHCDHCNTVRVRRDTFVVANGEATKRVGRNCLKDFLGHKDPNAIAAYLQEIHEFIQTARSQFSNGGWSDPMRKLQDLIPQIAAIIRVKGWVTRKMVERLHDEGRSAPPTSAGNLQDILNPYRISNADNKGERERIEALKAECAVTDEDTAMTDGVLNKMRSAGDGTDFWTNLNTLARFGAAPVKQWASLVAAVGMHMKDLGALKTRQAINNEHLPHELKAKIVLQVTLQRVNVFSGQFGETHLHHFRDAENHVVTWWSSRGKICNEGETILVKGTVKELDEYKGIKQTVLTRVKKVEAPITNQGAKS